jgi:hypothetical protein
MADESSRPASRFRFYLNATMAVLYSATGIVVFFFWTTSQVPVNNRRIAGTSLMIYGVYRFYRSLRSYRAETSTQQP